MTNRWLIPFKSVRLYSVKKCKSYMTFLHINYSLKLLLFLAHLNQSKIYLFTTVQSLTSWVLFYVSNVITAPVYLILSWLVVIKSETFNRCDPIFSTDGIHIIVSFTFCWKCHFIKFTKFMFYLIVFVFPCYHSSLKMRSMDTDDL